MKTFRELINEGLVNESKGDKVELINSNKVKKAFISDFKQGKLKDFEVKISDESGKVYDIKINPLEDPVRVRLFGSTRMLDWTEIYSLIKGNTSVINKDLDEALKYAFTDLENRLYVLEKVYKKYKIINYTYESIKYGNIEMVKGK